MRRIWISDRKIRVGAFLSNVITGLVPVISIMPSPVLLLIEMAGTSPAPTARLASVKLF
jgi:hypothetical protein